jgi:predicted nucleotidyltransferase
MARAGGWGAESVVMTDLSRYAEWLAWLTAWGAADADVRCVWVGGSAATGGYDDWSDLDVVALCTPGTAFAAYDRWLARARADFDVRDVWEPPAATWPDGRQAFLNLQDRPGLMDAPTRLVDMVVLDLADPHSHVDVRRHGEIIVLHDPDSLVVLAPEATAGPMAEALEQVRQRRVTGEWLVNRAIARGHVAEAVDLYLRFPLAGVVRLLRAEHCPWRHDFGLRYLREDLPPHVADRIEELVPGPASGPLEELSLRCYRWLDELLLAYR